MSEKPWTLKTVKVLTDIYGIKKKITTLYIAVITASM